MDITVLFLALSMVMCYFAILYHAFSQDENGVLIGGNVYINKLDKRNRRGPECELMFNKTLHHHIGKDDYLLSNVLIENNKETCGEIDSVLVSRKGLFCIEIKCNTGYGRGSENSKHWKFKKDPNRKGHSHVLNPFLQNERHCELLKEIIGPNYVIHNVVVFPNASSVAKIKSNKVFTTATFLNYFNSLQGNQLAKKDILKIVDELSGNIPVLHSIPTNKKLNKKEMSYFELP